MSQPAWSDRIVATLGFGVVAVDAGGRVVTFNAAAARLLGEGARDAALSEWPAHSGLYLPDGSAPCPAADFPLARALRGEPEAHSELLLRNPNLSGDVLLELSAWPLRDMEGRVMGAVALLRDVTARAAEREGARRREEFFERIVDHVAHPIFVKDRHYRFALLNRALCDLVGFPREAMLGKTDYDFFPKEQSDFFRAKDAEMFATARSVVIDEEPITDASGERHVLATTKVPLFDPAGEVTHLVGIIHDITNLKSAEQALRKARDEAQAASRELESFSYSVSHDLRAPLRSIDGFSQAIAEDHADHLDERGRDYLRRVRAAAQHMGHLIDDLLQLSRVTRAPLRREHTDLGLIARTLFAGLHRLDPARTVEWVIADDLIADGDPHLLRDVLENLLDNAWKFTARKEIARIELGVIQEESRRVYFVRDNGAGFDMTYADKLFSPFSRLHGSEEFAGTGIGLATVQRILHRHGGRIWAESKVGSGATFYFTIPTAETG